MNDEINKNIVKWNKDLNKVSTTIGEIKQFLKDNDFTLDQLVNEGLTDPVSKIESIKGKIEFLKNIRDNEFYFNRHALYDDDIGYYKNELKDVKDMYFDIISPLFTDEHIDEECDKIYETAGEKFLKEAPWNENNYDVVYEQCGEYAFNAAEYRAVFLSLMKYLSRCLWISGLAQIWEQQLIRFHNEILLQNKNFNLSFEDIKQSFKKNRYDFEEFEAYDELIELKHVVNTIKHGEGSSSKKLRKTRPEYFSKPDSLDIDRLHYNKTVLLEETLFITDEDFKRYYDSLISFWNEMLEKNRKILKNIN
ncbi:MAG: hypothetical protein ACRC1M_04475 [Methanobacteriaceae archaeon]